jgi:hypothetical protein
MTTRRELSVVDFFLDRIAVASPQSGTGLKDTPEHYRTLHVTLPDNRRIYRPTE